MSSLSMATGVCAWSGADGPASANTSAIVAAPGYNPVLILISPSPDQKIAGQPGRLL
jgi:hypothetical protein